MDLYSKIHKDIEQFKKDDAFRFLRPSALSNNLQIDLSTNDYLGIAQDKALLEEFYKAYPNIQLTASSSRLLSGNHQYYSEVETQLANLYQLESALFFNSGYHLNVGVLPSLTSKKDLILADKLVHASLIEGLHLSSAKAIRYRHLDYIQLEKILNENHTKYENIFIVSESVFSMDGDKADLKQLVSLKKKFGAYLYLDEAHAVGALGERGLGLAEEQKQLAEIDFLVGTMGKALASVGAYLICSLETKEFLVNKCKSLIYTTALPPVNVAWSKFLLDIFPNYNKKRESLSRKAKYLRELLSKNDIDLRGDTHILALILGSNKACLLMAKNLEQNSIKVQAVRPPTVPKGTARIRISLHDKLTYADLDKVADIIIKQKISNEA